MSQSELIERLRRFDENSDELFPKLLDAANITVDRDTGEIIKDKQGSVLIGLGIPDLLFRLECQQTREQRAAQSQNAVARAKIWRHVSEACKPGDAIADITHDSQLNAWLPDSHPKFTRPPILRNCESCGVPWDSCENHFALVPEVAGVRPQQTDGRKSWICYWCYQHAVVRRQFGMEPKAEAAPRQRKKRSPNASYIERVKERAASTVEMQV
jgi:hypothetical protein